MKEKIYLPTLTISQEPEPQDAASHEPERQKNYPAPQPCVVQIVDTTEKKKKKIQLYRIHLRPLTAWVEGNTATKMGVNMHTTYLSNSGMIGLDGGVTQRIGVNTHKTYFRNSALIGRGGEYRGEHAHNLL